MVTRLMFGVRVFALITIGAIGTACDKVPSDPTTPTEVTTVSVAITGADVLTHQGQTRQLKAIAHLSDGSQVDVTAGAVWRSVNPAVITVSATGLVTAGAPGACDVEAVSGGVTGKARLEVFGSIERIEVAGSLSFSKRGEASQLRAVAHFAGGGTEDMTDKVAWSSTNPEILTVSASGLATAHGEGDCDVVAVVQSLTGRAAVRVRIPGILRLRIVGDLSLTLPGQTSQLKAIAEFANGSEVDVTAETEWKTTNGGVVKVSADGLLQAMGPGDCKVEALHAGLAARADVRVLIDLPKVVGLTVTGAVSLVVGQTSRLRAVARMSDGSEVDVTDKTTWTTSNHVVSVFTEGGLLLAIAPGACDVVAVHAGVTARLTVRVTLLDEPERNATAR